MSSGAGAAAAATALVAGRRKKIVRAFRQAGATSEDRAEPLDALGLGADPVFRLLRRRGVVVEAGPGRFYLDVEREAEVARFRRRLVLTVVIVTTALILLAKWLDWI